MDNLMKHPIAKMFQDIRNIDNNETFSNPKSLSLSLIKARLQNRDILSINEWINQVELCLSNDSNFHDKQTKYYSAISNECKKIFKKLTNKMNLNPLEQWCTNIYHLHSKQLNFARQPPRKFYSTVNQLDAYKKIDNEKIIPLSNSEIKAFMQAYNMIKSEDIIFGLANTLAELQPEFKSQNTTELWVDLTKLDVSTIRALREYLIVELEKQGDHYPK